MLSGGVPITVQTVVPSPQTAALLPGQSYAGLVRNLQGALFAQIGTIQISLPESAALSAGQRVIVHVVDAGKMLQLEVSPLPGQTAPPAPPTPGLDRILLPILQALGKLDLAPRIHAVLPPPLTPNTASLQPLLTVLLSERALGQDLQQLQQVLTHASARGVLSPETAAAVLRWLEQGSGTGTGDRSIVVAWRNLLEQARNEQSAASQIGRSLQSGGAGAGLASLKDSAASLIQRLLNDIGFTTWLRDEGTVEGFHRMAGRIQDRALGADLLNTRSLDQPYQFLELPVRESQGFLRAHVHSFSEERPDGKLGQRTLHRTILDLDTTKLGPLWIALEAIGTRCTCRFRTANPDVAKALKAEIETLENRLRRAGFEHATVAAEPWDGDRETAVIQMLAPFQKLDLEG